MVLFKASWFSAIAAALVVLTLTHLLAQKDQRDEDFQAAINNADHQGVARIIARRPAIVKTRFEGGRTCLHLTAEMFLPLCGLGDKTDEYRDVLKMLVEAGADPNAVDKNGNPPLFTFAEVADLESIQYLLRNGADPLAINKAKQNALHRSAQLPHILGGLVSTDANSAQRTRLAQLLVAKGVDVNAIDISNQTPLHFALAATAGVFYAEWLIENGADVNHADEDGTTALHRAVLLRNTELVANLLERGADPRLLSRQYGTPLSLALKNPKSSLEKVFIDRGVLVSVFDLAAGGLNVRLTRLLEKTPDLINERDSQRSTPLHYSAICGNVACMKSLLAADADVSAKDKFGNTALHYAVSSRHDSRTGSQLVQALISSRADPNSQNLNAETPLHIATRKINSSDRGPVLVDGAIQVVAKLIELGAEVNAIDSKENTPLHNAAANGMQWTAQELLQANAITTKRNLAGNTPVDIARQKKFGAMVKLLTSPPAIRVAELPNRETSRTE